MTGASSMLFRRRAVSFRAVSMAVARRWGVISVLSMGAMLCGELIFELSMTAESRWEIFPMLSMGAMPRGEFIFELSMTAASRWEIFPVLSIGAMPRGEGTPEIFVCTTRRGAFIADVPVFAAGCREVICAA